ncbi:hypothetical protein [Fischerella sp. PCC 9605]|uniref:hypothetical protein n=1 Tax=Fischerella sp. PCC 9605 TaxID=1173024 RepID=UPI00047E2D9E|nr:hypothetical protein [Fischerella sp. PCC 9605]
MVKSIKHNSSPFASCPCCNVKVRQYRLAQHVLKVHKVHLRDLLIRAKVYDELQYWFKQVDQWLDKYMPNCYSYNEVDILKVMFAEEILGYKYCKIIDFIDTHKYSEEEYREKTIKLRKIFDELKSCLTGLQNFHEIQEYNSERNINWHECNSYETRFGKKYLGYLRRESKNRRFGSYPLHDDYSEESNPEGFTNLDY